MKKSQCCCFTLSILGAILLFAGAIVGALWFNIFEYVLGTQLILTNQSRSFGLWKETPLPMYIDLYMFNWTNPEETLNDGAKPNFQEMGPYVFSEKHAKSILGWNKNGTVTFKQQRIWQFEPKLSVGNLYDNVTNINVIAMTVGNIVQHLVPKQELPFVDIIIKKEEAIYVTKTVGELLFDGYDDKFLSLIEKLKKYIKIDLPFDRFAWFINRNGSFDYDGVFNMHTGSNDLYQLGNLHAWNYESQTKFFDGECGKVKGTTGELWPPNIADGDSVEVFASDVCSSVSLTREKPMEKFGLKGTYYVGDDRPFDNGTQYPENACYCIRNRTEPCQPSGTRDLSSCRYGAPAYVSYPHFYLADPVYREYVSGMKPSKNEHQFIAALAKDTGIPLEINARLQINIYVEPINGLFFYSHLPKAFMPQLWFDQHAEMSEDLASQLSMLKTFKLVGQPLFFTLCAVGVILLIVSAILLVRLYHVKKRKLILEHADAD